MSIEIVKVQIPLIGAADVGLVYDRKRKHVQEMPLLTHVKRQMGTDKKAFFKGAWSSIVGWGLSERVADQDW